MTEIFLRPAKRSDAADLAILDNVASHGISLWFWQEAVAHGKGENPMELGRMRMADDDAFFGWRNAVVAARDEEVLGSITNYIMSPLEEEDDEDEFKESASPFIPIFELFDLVNGHWFIDSLGVYGHARGNGIATMLVDDSLTKARNSEAGLASLVVEDSNTVARRIYESRGFEIADKRPYVEYDGPSETKEWLLMSTRL
ncbi:MAG: GNAT family N-acetyltransferase [Pseudomonadota bacterium]